MKHKGKTELLREYHGAEFTESEMENDPVGCISRILEDLRAEKDADDFTVMSAICRNEAQLAFLEGND